MRLITKLWATLLLLCVAGVANAAKTYEVDQKFTSIADLDGQAFAIVNEADTMAVYGSGAQNLGYASITTAVTGSGNSGYYFKVEAVEGGYLLRLQTPAGEPYNIWGSPGYLNTGDPDGTHGGANPFNGCFILGLNNQNGQDIENGAIWEIEYDAEKGFALKNKGLGGYFAGPNPAPTATDPIYWTFCTLKEGEEAPDPEPVVIPEPEAPLAEGELIPDFFSICDEGGIPYGYDVKFGSEDRAYPTTYTGGARIFNFAEGGDFTKAIYYREGYVQYGNVKKLALEAGKKYIIYFNSAMWKDSGATLKFTITKEGEETALMDSVISNTPNVNGSKNAVTGSTRSEIEFTPEADGNYILKWDAEGWKEVLLANVGVKVAPAVTPTPTDEPTIIDWIAGDQGYENAKELDGVAIDLDAKTTMTCAKGTGSTTPKYYTTGSAVRTYGGNTITFKGEGITKIIITGVNGKVAELTASTGELTKDGIITTWKGEANEIVLTNSTSDQQHIAKLHVVYGGVEADIEPVHIANTAETAYTVAKAIELIDAGDALDDTVFVKGIVSQVESFNDTYKNITYSISDDGTAESAQFKCYRGKGINGADFTSVDDIEVGAEVVVTGTMTKYGEIYEFNQDNALVSYKAPFKPLFADGKYYIYNVGAQKYLAAGANWGTHAVVNATGLDYEIKAADGKYTLDSQVSNGGANHFLNGEWNDGAAFGWTIAKVSDGIFTISNGEKFLTAGENGVVTLADDATAEAAQWSMKTLEARIAELATATAEAPVDATFLIQDADFGRNDLRKSAWKMEASNQNLSGGEDNNGTVGNNNAESYHSTFTLSQTLSKAPAGKYKMTAQGFYRQDDSATEDAPVFYANEKTGTFPAKTGSENSMTDAAKSFSAGQYTIDSIDVTVFEDGLLTIGAKGTATHQWVIFDNFRLTYLSSEIADEFKPAYENALAAAQAALVNEAYAAVIGEERTALEKAISDFATIPNTTDSVKLAISTLNAATSTFTGAKGVYEALAAAKAAKAQFDFTPYPYVAAAKVAAAQATLTAEATSAADATEKTAAINKAFRAAVESNAMLEDLEGAVNYTDSLAGANADQNTGWASGSIGTNQGQGYTDGNGDVCGKYLDGGWSSNAGANINLVRTLSLPRGKYILSVTARGSAALTEYTMSMGGQTITLPHNGADANTGVFGNGWDDAFLVFNSAGKYNTDTLQIIVKSEATQQWVSLNRFRLVKFPATAEEIALDKAIDALIAIINADKTIVTEGQKGAEELANAIATAETAAKAADATIESIAAARAALASAVATFTKANLGKEFVEIEQTQSPEISDGASRATAVEGDGYTQYTTDGGVCVIIKKYDIDVKDCDYVTIKFAEPLPNGINAAFWAQSGTDNVGMPAGTYEYKYVFADDAKCAIANDILPQLTLLTLWNSQTVSIAGVYKHKIPVTHTWDFTQWSEETVTNLKAEAAKGTSEGLWSDQEKADSSAVTKLISIENCYWQVGTSAAEGEELTANGQPIAELQGLLFKNNKARSLAIAVNYGDCSSANGADFGPYNGPSYLWLGSKGVEYFTIKNVKAGTEIKMGIESHKITDARGVQLLIDGTAIQGPDAPTTYTEQTWQIPTGEGVVDVVVKNTNGCHIYFIDAEIGEAPLPKYEYNGYIAVATIMAGNVMGDVTTSAQKVTITETENKGVVAIDFPGFNATLPPATVVTVPDFTFNANVTNGDSVTYVVADGSKVNAQLGQMDANYNLTGNGSQASAEAVPTIALQLYQNPMMTINVVFAANADDAKAALLKTTGIINIARDAQKNVIYNLNGQKVNKAQKGLYIINGKKVFK